MGPVLSGHLKSDSENNSRRERRAREYQKCRLEIEEWGLKRQEKYHSWILSNCILDFKWRISDRKQSFVNWFRIQNFQKMTKYQNALKGLKIGFMMKENIGI